MTTTSKPALLIRPNLTGKADPAVARAIANQSDQITALGRQISQVAAQAAKPQPIDTGLVRTSMQAGGAAPLNVDNLLGTLAQPQPPGGQTVTVTSNYAAHATDVTILADATGGALTVALPPAANVPGKIFVIKRLNSGANLVDVSSFDLIDGTSPQGLTAQYQKMSVQSDGTTYWIVG